MDVPETLRRALADRYALERELGQGGMATVYLAHDLRHDRDVALKVLRPELAATLGPERFLREIKIAAQLQHPNILPVHDSGEAAGFLYYVMPFVEGHSLRERLAKEGELPVPEAARILRDVADALSAAHQKGVVHRDIKPENVLLTGRHALVADFGVAKAVSEATGRQTLTTAGVALGTPTYMAPEQAAASPHIDHRADLYAFGVMAYEMLTGQPPFTAPTPQALLSAHVTEPPLEVTQRRATIPAPLAQLIMKCLAKKAADRPQTAEELLPVLETLTTPSGGITPTQTQPVQAVAPSRGARIAAALGGVVVLLALGALAFQLLRPKPLALAVSDITQVTNEPGVEFQPALSPGGQEVAFVAGHIRAPRLAIRSTSASAGGGEIRLADSSFRSERAPSWTGDGDLVRFWGCAASGCAWHEKGRLGGAARPAALPPAARTSVVAWSSDGSRVAFAVRDTILVSSVGDTAAHLVGVHTDNFWQLHSLAWSPDGRLIAYVNGNAAWRTSGNVAPASIWVVSSSGGMPRRVTSDQFLNVSPVWLDATHLLFVSDRDGARGAYVVAVGSGGARGDARIIPGIGDPHSLSYSAASRTLAFAKFTFRQNIWAHRLWASAPVSVASGVPVTTGNRVIEMSDVSADGRWLVFDSNRRGASDIYKVAVAGGEEVQLTDLPGDEFSPRWSPDGTEFVFHTGLLRGGGRSSIMVQSASGGMPVALATGPRFNNYPTWSPDGRHIAFYVTSGGRQEIWVLSRDSSSGRWHAAVQLADVRAFPFDWAPGGGAILARLIPGSASLGMVSLQGRVLWRRDLSATSRLAAMEWCRFSRGGDTIYCTATHSDGRRGVWAVPVSGGVARLVVASDDPALDLTGDVAVGPAHLYLTVSEYESDIWVAKLRW